MRCWMSYREDKLLVNSQLLTYATQNSGIMKPIPRQQLDKHVTMNTQWYGKMHFLCGPCRGAILKTTGATQAVVEAVSGWQFQSEYQMLQTDQQWN
jgi:hypothetical protein